MTYDTWKATDRDVDLESPCRCDGPCDCDRVALPVVVEPAESAEEADISW